MSEKRLFLVDAMSLAFRAFYALPLSITLPDGRPVNAVFGFTNLLFQMVDKLNPELVCVCFDMKGPTFRNDIYAEYKGHRPPPPDEFVPQIGMLKQLLDELRISRVESQGFEADDIIGTLVKKAEKEHIHSYIMTGDHDALQLVSSLTTVVMNKKGVSNTTLYTPEKVNETLNLSPDQIVDFKALKGDSSDNIPGVAGIGDKTATALLNDYHSLSEIYDNLDKITSKSTKTKLIEGEKNAKMSYDLATIHTNVPISISISDCVYTAEWDHILSVFEQYQFQTLIKKYHDRGNAHTFADGKPSPKAPDGTYRLIQTVKECREILPQLNDGFAIDLETTSLDCHDAEIVGVALSWKEADAVYIAMNDYVNIPSELDSPLFPDATSRKIASNPLLEILKPVLEDESIGKVTHNGKYEINVLRNYQIELKNITFDTMLAGYVIYPGERSGLKDMTRRLLDINMTTYDDVTGKGKQRRSFLDIDCDTACLYAAADADMTYRLMTLLKPKILENDLETIYYSIELPSQRVLADMERQGICLDTSYLRTLEREFDQRSEEKKQEVFKKTGEIFNLNSTKQLGAILYDKLNLPVYKKTKTGRSTDSSVLEKLSKDYDIAADILNYRQLEKLQNTYVRTLPTLINRKTGKIHTSFNQTVAVTGRLSSNHPNLQNIPIRSKEGSSIRKAFIPSEREGMLISADYSQIELRILAHLSEDKHMINAFNHGEDIHKATAALVFNVPLNDVTKEQRYKAKAVNFGIIYGQSTFGLSETLGIARDEAAHIIDHYYKTFSDIKGFMNETVKRTERDGFVKTEYGRIRYVPEINDRNKMRKNFGERIAINTRMQGTAADIMKIAMIQVQKKINEHALRSHMVIQVHDELLFDVAPDEADQVSELVRDSMMTAADLRVPLTVDVAVGNNWADIS